MRTPPCKGKQAFATIIGERVHAARGAGIETVALIVVGDQTAAGRITAFAMALALQRPLALVAAIPGEKAKHEAERTELNAPMITDSITML